MDPHPSARPIAQAERLAIVVADTIGKITPSALVRSLMALEPEELTRLGSACRAEFDGLRRAGCHPLVSSSFPRPKEGA